MSFRDFPLTSMLGHVPPDWNQSGGRVVTWR